MSPKQLANMLVNNPQGLIYIANIIHSEEDGLMTRNDISVFLSGIPSRLDDESDITEMLMQIALYSFQYLHESGSDFACARPVSLPHFAPKDQVRTIIPAVLLLELFDPDSLTDSYNYDYVDGRGLHGKPLAARFTDRLRERAFVLKPNAMLGHPQIGFFWVTPLDDVPAHHTTSPLAEAIRDYLGLIHETKELANNLLELCMPCGLLEPYAKARPTFIEGVNHTRFRVRSDHSDAQLATDSGFAVDLYLMLKNNTVIDGAKEIVIKRLPLSNGLIDVGEPFRDCQLYTWPERYR